MEISPSFISQLKCIDRNLSVIWNPLLERFQVIWVDPRTRKAKIVFMCEDDKGQFMPLDGRTLIYCSQNVDWKTLYKYPHADDMFKFFVDLKKNGVAKREQARTEYRKWWNKEHKKEWKVVLDNARKGILSLPDNARERKIFIDHGGR